MCAVCEQEDTVVIVESVEVHITKQGHVCHCTCHK